MSEEVLCYDIILIHPTVGHWSFHYKMIKISTAFTISITAYNISLQYFSNVTERESLQGLWRLCPPQYIIQCSESNENVQNNGVKKYEHIYYKLILYAKIKIIDLHSDICSLKVQQLWSDPKCKYYNRSKWSAFISSPFQMIIGQQMYLTQSFNKALFLFYTFYTSWQIFERCHKDLMKCQIYSCTFSSGKMDQKNCVAQNF